MLITNKYNSRLNFDEADFALSIEPGEILRVDDRIGKILLRNRWITQVKEVKKERKSFKKKNKERSKKKLSNK